MRKPRERDHYNAIIEFLQLHGIFAFRLNAGLVQTIHRTWVKLGPKGASDILGIIGKRGTHWHGRCLCIECKLEPTAVATLDQEAWLDGMRRAGALVIVAHDVKEVEEALKREGVIT